MDQGVKRKALKDGSEYLYSTDIANYYARHLNEMTIKPEDIPNCFIKFKDLDKWKVMFKIEKFDPKHYKLIVPAEKFNIFNNQSFILNNGNYKNLLGEELFQEICFLGYQQVTPWYPHYVKFSINSDLTIEGSYKMDGQTTKATAGKVLRKIPWLFEKKDAEIEKMVNVMKSILLPELTFTIVSGDEIRFWYSHLNYASSAGSLNNSCMRSSECQRFFDIYTKNKVKMLIATDSDDKLHGRALLWSKELWNKDYFEHSDTVMDRIYGNDATIIKFKKYAENNNYVYKTQQTFSNWRSWQYPTSNKGDYETIDKRMKMILDEGSFEYYPYLDTFAMLDSHRDHDGHIKYHLKNYGNGEELTDTNGGYNDSNNTCSQCDSRMNEDDTYWVNDEPTCADCCTYSDYDDQSYLNCDIVWSEHLNSHIHVDDSVEITHGFNSGDYTHINETTSIYGINDSYVDQGGTVGGNDYPFSIFRDDKPVIFRLFSSSNELNHDTIDLHTHDWNGTRMHTTYNVHEFENEKYIDIVTGTDPQYMDSNQWYVIMQTIAKFHDKCGIDKIKIHWPDEIVETRISGEFFSSDNPLCEVMSALAENFNINQLTTISNEI